MAKASNKFKGILQDRFHHVLTKQMLPGMVLCAKDRFLKSCMQIYAETYPQYKKEKQKITITEALEQFLMALRIYGVSFNKKRFEEAWNKNWELMSEYFEIPPDFQKK